MKNNLICIGFFSLLYPFSSQGQFHTLGKKAEELVKLEQDSLIPPKQIPQLTAHPINKSQTIIKSNVSLPLRRLMVTSPRGLRKHPVNGKPAMHNGIDLRAHYDSVFSVLDGVVLNVGYDHRSGRWIRIAHPGSLRISYAHLSHILVKKGQAVKSGECIGISGNSGKTTGPHLHLSLNFNRLNSMKKICL